MARSPRRKRPSDWGRSERQVRNLCRSGQLRARRVGESWLVDAAEVESYRAGRAAAG